MYPRAETIEHSDQLRNITCHEYLFFIQEAVKKYLEEIDESISIIPHEIEDLLKLLPSTPYQNEQTYGNDYTSFMEMLDAHILEWRQSYKHTPVIYNLLNLIVESIYDNPNQGLKRATDMITPLLMTLPSEEKTPLSNRIKNRMAKSTGKKVEQVRFWQTVNASTPHQMESGYEKLKNTHLGSLKVQHKTNTPNIRMYHYKNDLLPKEFRFGTQAQYEGTLLTGTRTPIIAPIFESFIALQKEKRDAGRSESKEDDTNPITHIYFNYLKKTPNNFSLLPDVERNVEGVLTDTLDTLEETYDNIAVITLPADNHWISYHALEESGKVIKTNTVLNEIKEIVSEKTTLHNFDFHISDRVRKLLFASDEEEQKIIDDLLQNSLENLNLIGRKTITSHEKQALYFHFIKFELTDFIITKLNPSSFNMSCKDAIDRGGVSSAYYNLMKSLQFNQPLHEEEFYQALYGAPALVKGRGMNDHMKIIWNAVNIYLKNPQNTAPDWLKQWCANHSQKTSITKKLEDYIGQNSSTDPAKMSVATTLKNLSENPLIDPCFTFPEWKALQDGRLKTMFNELENHLSNDQRKKLTLLNDLYSQILKLQPYFPAMSGSSEYDLGIQLWAYANTEDLSTSLGKRERILIADKKNTQLPDLLSKIDTLRDTLLQQKNANVVSLFMSKK